LPPPQPSPASGGGGRSTVRDARLAQVLLAPQSIAIIGQSNDATKTAGRPLKYLRQAGYGGRIYPINPRRDEVLGEAAWASLGGLPEIPDHAYIVTSTDGTMDAIEECARIGVPVVTALANGFSETGAEGTAREGQIAVRAVEPDSNIWGLVQERRKVDRYKAGSDSETARMVESRELAAEVEDLNLDLQAIQDAVAASDAVDIRLRSYFRIVCAHIRAVNGTLEQWLKLQADHADPFIALTNLQAARIRHTTEMIRELLHDVESGEADFSGEEMTALSKAVDALAKYLGRMFRVSE